MTCEFDKLMLSVQLSIAFEQPPVREFRGNFASKSALLRALSAADAFRLLTAVCVCLVKDSS